MNFLNTHKRMKNFFTEETNEKVFTEKTHQTRLVEEIFRYISEYRYICVCI